MSDPAAPASAAASRPDLRVAPSILSADFARLADEIAEVTPAVELVHVDVMDGHYVPNLTLGPPVIRSLRGATSLFLDCHLMISDPRTYAPQCVAAGADSVTFHPEVEDDPAELVELLRDAGSQVGVAVRPHQPLSLVEELLPSIDLLLVMTVQPGFGGQAFQAEVLPKIEAAAAARQRLGASFRIEVDGGISPTTVGGTARAGADTFVAGSAVFDRPDRAAAAREVLAAALAATGRDDATPSGSEEAV